MITDDDTNIHYSCKGDRYLGHVKGHRISMSEPVFTKQVI